MMAPCIEYVRLRRASPSLGFTDVRLRGVLLRNLRAGQLSNDVLEITMPTQRDKAGRLWLLYTLQPGTRGLVEAEFARVWGRSTGADA